MSRLRSCCAACLFLTAMPAMAQTTIPASSADWILDGSVAEGTLGVSAAPAGDIDGDGFDDVLIATGDTFGLYRGSALGLETAPAWSYGPALIRTYSYIPLIFSMGDVNRDGFDDVVILDPGIDDPVRSAAYLLFLGSASGLSALPAWQLPGIAECAGGGDFDGDGFIDLAVQTWEGIRIFRGSASGLEAAPSWTLLAPTAYGGFVAFRANRVAIQDLDGDGFADLATTSVESRGNSIAGRLFVYRGTVTGPELAVLIDLDYSKGHRLATAFSAGDANGDGRDDLVLTFFSSFYYPAGQDEPETVLFFEGSRGVLRRTGHILLDGIPSDALQHTGSAGDLNGDGYGDLIVAESFVPVGLGDPYHRVQLFTGGRHGPGDTPAAIIVPGQPGDLAPAWDSTGRAGDVNGDGYDDVMVGVPFYDGVAPNAGRVYVFHGKPSF